MLSICLQEFDGAKLTASGVGQSVDMAFAAELRPRMAAVLMSAVTLVVVRNVSGIVSIASGSRCPLPAPLPRAKLEP